MPSVSHTSLQQIFSSCQLFPMQCLPPQHLHSCQVAGRISLSGEDGRVLPHYCFRSFLTSCSYLCQESLLCFLITANQLLHHHHLSCCFVSHLGGNKTHNYRQGSRIHSFDAPVTSEKVQHSPESREDKRGEEIQSPGIC